MPTTRRSTGGARAKAGPGKGQSTISFSSKVTKSVPNDTKKALLADSFVKTADVSLAKPVEDEVDEVEEKVEEEVEPEEESAVPRTDAELRAEKITSAQLAKYWKKIEGQRKAPRVHQQDVTLGEKILRYFDVSSQYGPCIGIQRTKRWERAERLGLNPPIEVLAVLLQGDRDGKTEKAQIDEIMNTTITEA